MYVTVPLSTCDVWCHGNFCLLQQQQKSAFLTSNLEDILLFFLSAFLILISTNRTNVAKPAGLTSGQKTQASLKMLTVSLFSSTSN